MLDESSDSPVASMISVMANGKCKKADSKSQD